MKSPTEVGAAWRSWWMLAGGACVVALALFFNAISDIDSGHDSNLVSTPVPVDWLVALALLLAASMLIVLRGVMKQQQALLQANSDVQELRLAHDQLVENLPVGLFTFRSGEVLFSNWAWDEQVMRHPSFPRTKALLQAVSPEDRDRLLQCLERSERKQDTLDIQYEIVNENGKRHFIETRAVPVFDNGGKFQHLLGFNLDLTSLLSIQRDLEEKNQALAKTLGELEDNLQAIVTSLVKVIEAKDPYTAGHSERVMEYSVKIAQEMGLESREIKILRMGTLMHDIGKIGIPDEVLTKPGSLTDEEFDLIKLHPSIGYNMIRNVPLFQECTPIVRWHHERLNGSGYPDGLKGSQIPLLVRISAVADAYDAMTSTRAYRKSLSQLIAVSELRKDVEKGSLDPDVVQALENVLRREQLLPMDAAA
jgi:HD-GYP domain-containing protein (c-di-GMP phosphodiesterase class II)